MHTKGEWVAKGTDIFLKENDNITQYKLARVQRAVYYEVKLSVEEVEANARLMAESPKMFRLLETSLERLEEKSDRSNRDIGLINAIMICLRKVKGE